VPGARPKVVTMTAVRAKNGLATFTSGQPLVMCDTHLRVVGWNAAAERLTGIPSADAVGRGCWEVVDAVDRSGLAVCGPDCLHGRLARAGCPVAGREALVPTPCGRRSVLLSTITLRSGTRQVILHLLQPAPGPEPARAARAGGAASAGAARLTARQQQVLALLAEGRQARAIGRRLGIKEATVRNHIHAILAQLGCHSQLAAIARARREGLV
jgi:DNA-binding CsgD family transcriptional regulator